MSFNATSENIDESILRNMGDLTSVIEKTQYRAGSPDMLPEGVNLSGVGDPNAPGDLGQYTADVTDPGMPAVTPQTDPGAGYQPGAAEAERLRQVAYDASMRRIEAEELAFQAQLDASGLSDEEKMIEVLKRELGQTKEVNSWLSDNIEGQKRQAVADQLRSNKNQWMVLVAHQAGLKLENPGVRAALEGSANPAHMRQIAQGLSQAVIGNQAVASQNVMNSGILAPGGRMAPATPQGPKQRSGDVAGLIASRGGISVNMG